MTRGELDREMRAALAQLETCSHVPAAGWGPGGGGRSSDDPPGGGRPPGDLGHTHYARAYGPPFHERTDEFPGCTSDAERAQVLQRTRDELEALRGHGAAARERPAGETRAERDKRIVDGGEDFTPREVAIKFRCSERDVRRARVEDNREPDFGRKPERCLEAAERRARALDLADAGYSVSYIARRFGVHRSTIERDLGKRAA